MQVVPVAGMADQSPRQHARLWLTYPAQLRDRLYALASDLSVSVVQLAVVCLAIGLREMESRVYHDPPALPPDDPSIVD